MSEYHIPVMPAETIEFLDVQPGKWYLDCNLGGGGHTELILKAGGKVIGIDLDPDAIHEVAKKHNLQVKKIGDHLEAHSKNLILYQSNFAEIDKVINNIRHSGDELSRRPESADKIDSRFRGNDILITGILFDLGVSTHQLDEASRGFSFNTDATLDMRMNKEQGVTAADLVNGLYEKELADLFWKLGEENFAKPIAREIVRYRQIKTIATTNDLANIILSVRHRSAKDRTHPATRIFQALRIAVNDELNSLKVALPKAFELLSPGGRLVVLSFHSLEDRIVKNYFKDWIIQHQLTVLTKKPIETSESEVQVNPRARSAKLRAVEKI